MRLQKTAQKKTNSFVLDSGIKKEKHKNITEAQSESAKEVFA